jgi:hypothetical protein
MMTRKKKKLYQFNAEKYFVNEICYNYKCLIMKFHLELIVKARLIQAVVSTYTINFHTVIPIHYPEYKLNVVVLW